jgi:hypothetical protein
MFDAVVVYAIIDDLLKDLEHVSDSRQKMTDSEVITTMVLAHMNFQGNIERARQYYSSREYIPDMLSSSRLNRRIHALTEVFNSIFAEIAKRVHQCHPSNEYILDSFPVSVCHRVRINRCHLLSGEEYRGKCTAKREYFYGFKVQVIVTAPTDDLPSIPVEFGLLPGSAHDSRAFDVLAFDLPRGSALFADSAYTDYNAEDAMNDRTVGAGLDFSPCRRKKSTRGDELPTKLYKEIKRKAIETTFSLISQLLPRKIHAVTIQGFMMKVFLTVLAFALTKSFKLLAT